MLMQNISVAIPTYRREKPLLRTLEQLLALEHAALEILVIDQSTDHEPETVRTLEALAKDGRIDWRKLSQPSIPKAMNHALQIARADVVLFVDDDTVLNSELIREHAKEHEGPEVVCVAGRVVQLWEQEPKESEGYRMDDCAGDPDVFPFNSRNKAMIERFMGGNFSINKGFALSIGGFDENFVKAAYRFEAEFSNRLALAGEQIVFQPDASVLHLKEQTGGTRSFGSHLRTIWPAHSVGRYYYLFMVKPVHRRIRRIVLGPLSAVITRHHLKHPWWIPLTLISELSGMVWALWLCARGPRLLISRVQSRSPRFSL
ncbi:MAG: glycosyltransferase family 2 protein [Lysobacterales bacterium]|nr:MAG: glycosyltransferase family 2 protein [Xanthomonadales bacterium]